MLRQALREQKAVNGARFVLYDSLPPTLSEFLSPFVQAAFEVTDKVKTRSASWLSVADFERLSLLARGRLAGVTTHVTRRDNPAYADGDLAQFPEVSPDDIIAVLTEEASRLGAPPLQTQDGQVFDAGGRASLGLQIVGCRIRWPDGRWSKDPRRKNEQNHALDLRLINARQPITLRLIGCVIDCPIAVTNCEMGTLDLSGSAMRALNATGLRTLGSVRLRRTTFLAPVDFGGAHVRSVFDASDVVIMPWSRHPTNHPYSPNRGVLNLAEGTFENDVYLSRARVWGGLHMPDAVMERSVFMTQAVIRSPMGVLERLAAELVSHGAPAAPPAGGVGSFPFQEGGAPDTPADILLKHLLALRRENRSLARQIHAWRKGVAGPNGSDAVEDFIQAEVVLHPGLEPLILSAPQNDPAPERIHASAASIVALIDGLLQKQGRATPVAMEPLVKLLFENARAATTAIWADGIKVQGRVFAERLKATGRFRIRYAALSDGLHLKGAVLRSPETIRRSLDGLKDLWEALAQADPNDSVAPRLLLLLCDIARRSRAAIARTERTMLGVAASPEAELSWDVCALDLREAKVGGCLDLGEASGAFVRGDGMESRIEGVISAERAEIGGQVSMTSAAFSAPEPTDAASDQAYPRGWSGFYAVQFPNAKLGGDLDLRGATGLRGLKLEEAQVGGGVFLSSKWRLLRRTRAGVPAAPPASGPHGPMSRIVAVIGRKLRDWWINKPIKPSTAQVACADRAIGVRGDLDLRSAVVAGDAYLIFDPDVGPNIRAELLSVGRRLDIYPQALDPQDGEIRLQAQDFDEVTRVESARLRELQAEAEVCSNDAWPHVARQDTFIDLRHASAVLFCHPWPAWPHVGGLSIDGFVYRRSSDIGPLAPHAFPNEEHADSRTWPSRWRRLGRWWSLVPAAAVIGAIAAMMTWGVRDAPVVDVLYDLGPFNLTLVALLVLSFLAWDAAAQLGPKLAGTRPLAIPYLQRQLPGRARYRTRGPITRALDPYVRASKVLLEEGRTIPSQIVEVERIRQRRGMMSFRHHFVAKIFLWLLEKLTESGFRVTRAVMMTFVFILAAAMIANWCHAKDALVASQEGDPEAIFLSLVYAADLVIPILDIGQTDAWVPKAPAKSFCPELYFAWPAIFTAIGVFMTTVIGAALAGRVQTVFARTSE